MLKGISDGLQAQRPHTSAATPTDMSMAPGPGDGCGAHPLPSQPQPQPHNQQQQYEELCAAYVAALAPDFVGVLVGATLEAMQGVAPECLGKKDACVGLAHTSVAPAFTLLCSSRCLATTGVCSRRQVWAALGRAPADTPGQQWLVGGCINSSLLLASWAQVLLKVQRHVGPTLELCSRHLSPPAHCTSGALLILCASTTRPHLDGLSLRASVPAYASSGNETHSPAPAALTQDILLLLLRPPSPIYAGTAMQVDDAGAADSSRLRPGAHVISPRVSPPTSPPIRPPISTPAHHACPSFRPIPSPCVPLVQQTFINCGMDPPPPHQSLIVCL